MSERDGIEVIGRGVAWRDGSVLLCRDVAGGYYYLPGGHVDPGEAAAEATAREFLEETGLKVRPGRLEMVAENRFRQGKRIKHELLLVFHVEHAGGPWPAAVQSREEPIAFEWVDLAAIVDLDVRPTSTKAFLASGVAQGGESASGGAIWVSEG